MSTTARPSDIIRTGIIDNLLTGYKPAVMWRDDQLPFSTGSDSVVVVKTEGRSRDGVYNVFDCQVWLFSPVNSTGAQMSQLIDDAISAKNWIYTNPKFSSDILITHHIEDVSDPIQTDTNRFICRFTVEVYSGDPDL